MAMSSSAALLSTLQISLLRLCPRIGASALRGAMGKLSGNKLLRSVLDAYTTLVRSSPGADAHRASSITRAPTRSTCCCRPSASRPCGSAASSPPSRCSASCRAPTRPKYCAAPSRPSRSARSRRPRPSACRPCCVSGGSSFPPCCRYAIPGMSNLWLNVTKDSALIAVVGYSELAARHTAGGRQHQALSRVLRRRLPSPISPSRSSRSSSSAAWSAISGAAMARYS